ncbi:MAG: hypothetical protein LQ337_002086 [Flavoplaca oasis]|nr:MAG: hypothetical protein LQ337_002086 [Flavoplaca oasis]
MSLLRIFENVTSRFCFLGSLGMSALLEESHLRRGTTFAALDAHTKMTSGLIGHPSIFRSQTYDKLNPSGFFVAFAQHSGGIFVDCSIHDIDLAFWFFGQNSKVKSVVASGITAVQSGLRKWEDRDNAVGIVEFYEG